jgi:hypothetical protein
MKRKKMIQVTHWLEPNRTYLHKVHGEKTNLQFCEEIAGQIDKDKIRTAHIRNKKDKVAVFATNIKQKRN